MPASSAAWIVAMLSARSAGPYMPDMPMQPRPSAETAGPEEPRERVSIRLKANRFQIQSVCSHGPDEEAGRPARILRGMTTKADFAENEWERVLTAPPMAGMMVITADRGGRMRETFAMAKACGEARSQHGNSELLDAIVATKPERDHGKFRSYDELRRHGSDVLREAVATLEAKATAEEVDEFRKFVLTLAQRVAERRRGRQPARAGGDRGHRRGARGPGV